MISSILANSNLYNLAQTTQAQVGIETGLKAIGRPTFILVDNKIDKNTKKYAATKEFLYQLTCLALSLGIVIPVFKKGSFAIAKKLFKDEPIFKAFKKSDEFNKFYGSNFARLTSEEEKAKKLAQINKEQGTDYKLRDLYIAKGMIDGTSTLGSILALSVMSPLISRPFIRPILRKIGLDNPKESEKSNVAPEPVKAENSQNSKLDVKA